MKFDKLNSQVLNGGKLYLGGRISYPKLFTPQKAKGVKDGKPRYGCNILLPKTDKAAKAMLDERIEELKAEKLKGKKVKSTDICVIDGDGEDGDEFSGGCWIISANRAESQGRPQVVDRKKNPLAEADNAIFAGHWCYFVIDLYVPKDWAKVCACLEVVKHHAEDDTFGAGAVNLDDIPDDLPDDMDEDDDGLD